MKPSLNSFWTTSCLTAALLLAGPACANPENGTVSSGAATISSNGTTLNIVQSTHKAVIDWGGFDIGAAETTAFHQPSSSAVTLNRVHSAGPSVINGTLTANGNLFIINQNGVLFGAGSRVDVNGLVVSTADISDSNFNAGNFRFDRPGSPNATIENRGQITAAEAGLVGLVAPNVLNSGVIQARLGRVHLASGDTATVDLYGDGLMEVAVSDAVTNQLVNTTGTIQAEGGTIALTAAAGANVVNSLIHVSGELRAPSVGVKRGTIIIAAEGSNAVASNVETNKGTRSGVSTVVVEDAVLDVSGKQTGETGGSVTITGDHVAIAGSTQIDASGADGGGVIHVGGQYLGGGDTPVALVTLVQDGVIMSASALVSGHGGEVVAYADDRTEFYGTIAANGAGDNGDGGFVETSGRVALIAFGNVRTIAGRNGKAGVWLLDPADITITAATNSSSTSSGTNPITFTATATAAQVSAATIVSSLNAGSSVIIQTSSDGYAGSGDITVSSAISTTGSGSLTLSAYRNIAVNSAITLTSGSLTLRSDNTGAGSGAVSVAGAVTTAGGNVTIGGGSGSISAGSGYAVGNSAQASGVSISGAISAAGGNIIINGKGYNTSTNSNYGVHVTNTVGTTGSGTVTLNGIGQGNTNSANDYGIYLTSGISTVNGLISITGTAGGAGTASASYGVVFSSGGGNARASGTGNISVTGTGGGGSGGNAHGVVLNYASALQTNSGTISVTGTGGGGSTSASDNGISLTAANAISTTSGSISLTGTGGVGSGGSQYGVLFTAGQSLVNGSMTINGTGSAAGGAGNFGVVFGSGGGYVRITGTGSLAITGTGGATAGANSGVLINYASAVQTHSGALTVTGTGGGTGSASGSHGVAVQTTNGISTTGGGTITVTGTGAVGTGGTNLGVHVTGSIVGSGGTVSVTGTGGLGSGNTNHGVYVNGGTISNSGSGALGVTGTGRGTSNSGTDYGVYVAAAGTISTADGALTVSGTGGGAGSGASNHGVYVTGSSSTIKSTGSGAVSVTGTGGNSSGSGGTNYGVYTTIANAITTTGTGSITVNGTKGGQSTSYGVYDGTANAIKTAGSSGNITVNTDTLYLGTANSIVSVGALTLAPLTSGSSMGVGSGAGALSVTDAYIGYTSAASYVFGNTSTGTLTVNSAADFTTKNVSFISGGDIAIASSITKTGGSGSTVTMQTSSGTLSNSSTINGAYNLTATAATISFASALGDSTALGTVALTATNGITLPSISASSITVQTTGTTADITIASGKTLAASGTGTAITLASGRNFINSSGSSTPLSAASGRWLVYSTNATADTRASMTSGFVRYGCTYGGSCPTGTSIPGSGNGFVYSYQPTLTITPSAQSITYGGSATISGYSYDTSGYLTSAAGSDSAADTLSGTLTGTTGYAAGSNVGSYGITYSSDTLSSVLGYAFSYANNASAITVGQRTLTVSLTGAVSKTYDASTAATLGSSNYSLSNVYGADSLSISTTSGTYADANVGTGKSITVTGLTLSGAKAANYTLSASSATGSIGAITKKTLTATADHKTITEGASVPVGNVTYSGFAGSETSAVIDTLATVASAQSGTPAIGTYTGNYTASGAVDANYSFTYVAGNLVVNSLGSSTSSSSTSVQLPPTVELVFNYTFLPIPRISATLDVRPLMLIMPPADAAQGQAVNASEMPARFDSRNDIATGYGLPDALIYVTPSLAREMDIDQSQI